MAGYASWGNFPPARQAARTLSWRDDPLPLGADGATVLPRGLGRSYGDSCLNDGGVLLDTRRLDHLIEFDRDTGVLRCEAGVSLDAILELLAPQGWFPPVTPGTRFVTIGGAIANDVHGKNHHRAGTFGRFVERFELLRSDGRRTICSAVENADLFRATIGGLGLTGLITWAEIRMKRVASERIDRESVRFGGLDEFFELTRVSDESFEYTAAWIDSLARGRRLGRGLFLRGNHAAAGDRGSTARTRGWLSVPCNAPGFLLNRTSIRLFNTLYYRRQRNRLSRRTAHYGPFFHPLDSIGNWNRLYGRRGFLQYQCLVPHRTAREALRSLLERIAVKGEASFLAVLKVFGDLPSPGMLSFPRPGVTLALDFPNRGARTFELLNVLDDIVAGCGGRVYPAKDARMSAASFRRYYPEWTEFARHVDPRFSSGFWRRVTGDGTGNPTG
jgi:FAD/FMN-containing dehydrogenase